MFLTSLWSMTEELNNLEENLEQELPLQDNPQDTPAETSETVENELEVLKRQVQEANDKYLRLYAEFDNYRRRSVKEKSEILQTAGKDVMLTLLPVIDNFERAQKSSSTNSFEAYKEGVELIHNQFNSILNARGLKSIESVGQEFNVDLHEAITNIPAPSEDMKGKVIDETEKGYTLNGHVIRFAKVVVGE